ncbi:MAG: hypothetical protein WC554_08920 [Clostridia bacterium]
MKFESYIDWLYEREMITKPDFGCIMLYCDIPNWKSKHLAQINSEDIYNVPDKGMSRGLEYTPHCTLVYGLHLNTVKPTEIKKIMETFFPLKVSIKKLTFFVTPDCDVVKYDVSITKELKAWREKLLKFPNTQTYPDYHPHITLSYVKTGSGIKYIKEFDEPFKVIFNKVVYSYTGDEKENIVVKLDEV